MYDELLWGWYMIPCETLLHTYPLHDIWDLGESLLRHLLLDSKKRGLVDVRLG